MIDETNPCVTCNVAFPDCTSVCPKYAEWKCKRCIYSTQDGECGGQCLIMPPSNGKERRVED